MSGFVDTGEDWEKYLERMSKNKEWGSHIELTALADALGIPILITTDSVHKEQYQVWIYTLMTLQQRRSYYLATPTYQAIIIALKVKYFSLYDLI